MVEKPVLVFFTGLRPRFSNPENIAPDPSKAKFIGLRVAPSPVSAVYAQHSRQYWPGAGKIQDFDSTTFANNHGYIDADRYFDNPDRCLRYAITGGSDTVALQVGVGEKYSILFEPKYFQ